MPYRVLTSTSIRVTGIALCLAFFSGHGALANPVLDDEQSRANGAELYDLYCSSCHGVSAAYESSGGYAGSASTQTYDFSDLIDSARIEDSAPVPAAEQEWPDWVETDETFSADSESAVRSEVMNEITRVIDEAYGIESETESSLGAPQADAFTADQPPVEAAEIFDPIPGITNLADPSAYYYGTSDEDMFNSIANGTGAAMPGWRLELGSDDAIWDLVNYIRSFWSEEWMY